MTVVCISAGKVPDPRPILLGPGDFSTIYTAEDRKFPVRVAKVLFGSGFLCHQVSCLSAVVEDESPAVVERNLLGLPGGTLVEGIVFALCAGRVPFLIEPVRVRVVIRDPLLDGLPGWLDGLHGVDIEGWRWRARKLDDAFPEILEAEQKYTKICQAYKRRSSSLRAYFQWIRGGVAGFDLWQIWGLEYQGA